MTDVLVFWRDFRKNKGHGDALRWHPNSTANVACLVAEVRDLHFLAQRYKEFLDRDDPI